MRRKVASWYDLWISQMSSLVGSEPIEAGSEGSDGSGRWGSVGEANCDADVLAAFRCGFEAVFDRP
jgi:hypothetical protein